MEQNKHRQKTLTSFFSRAIAVTSGVTKASSPDILISQAHHFYLMNLIIQPDISHYKRYRQFQHDCKEYSTP